jgi:hypothetical protein
MVTLPPLTCSGEGQGEELRGAGPGPEAEQRCRGAPGVSVSGLGYLVWISDSGFQIEASHVQSRHRSTVTCQSTQVKAERDIQKGGAAGTRRTWRAGFGWAAGFGCVWCTIQLSIKQELLNRNVQWFRGGLVFKAHELLYHSTVGPRVMKKKNTAGQRRTLRAGFGSRVSDFGFRVLGFGFRVSGFGFRVSGFGSRISGFGFSISGLGYRVSGFGLLVSGFESRVSGFGFRVSGSGFRASGSGCLISRDRVSGFGFRVDVLGFQVSGLEFGFQV